MQESNVYVWSSSRRECRTESRRTREVVVAANRAEVLRTIGETCSPNPVAFEVRGARTPEEVAVAHSAPGVIFWRAISAGEGGWWCGTDGSRVRYLSGERVVRHVDSGDEPGVVLDMRRHVLAEHVAQLLRQAPPARLRIVAGFLRERLRQDKLYPFDPTRPDGTGGPAAKEEEVAAKAAYERARAEGCVTWRDTLREEVAESLASDNPEHLATELLQSLAVCGKWLEALAARGVEVELP